MPRLGACGLSRLGRLVLLVSSAVSPPDLTAHEVPRKGLPGPWESRYLFHRALAVQMRAQAGRRLKSQHALKVVDVGCGTRPYEHIFKPYAEQYIGVDLHPGPRVDVVAAAEDLPFEDASFDCAICSQVLEHTEDPRLVVTEMSRVLRPAGVLFLSTHGVIRYHATPNGSVPDYWRWTHSGLERLITTSGQWREVDVYPNGGTWTALAFLLGYEIEVAGSKLGVGRLLGPLALAMNVVAWNLDRLSRRLLPGRPPDLVANYLVVAVR